MDLTVYRVLRRSFVSSIVKGVESYAKSFSTSLD